MHEKQRTTGPIANMSGIKTAIANNEASRLQELIAGQSMDALQKSYLIELARMSNTNIQKIIENIPTTS